MRLEISNNNGTRYIRIVETIRVTENGKSVTKKKIIQNIGPVSRFTDGEEDFETRLKESYLAGEPIIPELLEFVPKSQPVKKHIFKVSDRSEECIGHPKLFAHILLEKVMEEIDLINVVKSYKGFSKIKFDLMGYLRLLIYGRILNPASKIATFAQNNDYFEPIVDNEYAYHVYDTLDFVYEHKKQIFNRINSSIERKFKRDTSVIYYDVTNFYFEIENPDEDIYEDGKLVEKGSRKNGVSKENKKEPIVQMGLFMDNSGIPISCEMFPGNTLDHQTVRESLKNSVDNMNFQRYIFVGDRGMQCYTNALHILSCGNGYILSKSIHKNKKAEKEWIYDQTDYIHESDKFRYKSRIQTRYEKNENGDTVKITEKVVVYWSKKYYDREVAQNKSFMELIEKVIASPNSFRLTASQSNNIKKYLKDDVINTETGELLSSAELKPLIDYSKVEAQKKTYGYFQIVTSELDMPDKQVIEVYRGLSKIEDQFRVMKGELNTRPIFVKSKEHIDAHLSICTIALIITRIIQSQIVNSGLLPKTKNKWSFGLPASRLQAALNKWTVEKFADDYYRFNNLDDPDLKLILDAVKINIPKKLFQKSELKRLKSTIQLSNGYIK